MERRQGGQAERMSIKRWKLGWKRCHLIECTSALTVEQTEEDCGWVHWREHKDEVARLKAEVDEARRGSGAGMGVMLDLNNQLVAENARLKAEVERLRASSFVTAVPVEQYERLRKAGDAMADWMDELGSPRAVAFLQAWNAAKEGKQS